MTTHETIPNIVFLTSKGKLLFTARVEESYAREHKVPIDVNYSAYWGGGGHINYKIRNKSYHSVLMQFTSISIVTANLHNKCSRCLSTPKSELTILLTL
jgi:hypothetical protein